MNESMLDYYICKMEKILKKYKSFTRKNSNSLKNVCFNELMKKSSFKKASIVGEIGLKRDI